METSLVHSHILGGRLYPRPKAKCDHCVEEVILCWGEKVTVPYWRHPSGYTGGNDGHRASCESATHKLAKKLLAEYLTRGGHCSYSHGCHTDLKIPDVGCVKFVEEYVYKDIRWDIGCLSIADELLFGIEIRVTHVVNKISTRDEVPWVEIDANDVLFALDKAESPSEITLNNLSSTEPCCLKKLEPRTQFAPPKVLPSPITTKSKNPSLQSLSQLDIARKLRFLIKERIPPHKILHTLAIQGKMIKREIWQERGDVKTYKSEIADEFLSRYKCLKCEHSYRTESCFKPYCGRCYYSISNDGDAYYDSSYAIDPKLKLLLRRKIGAWMSSIPTGTFSTVCSICNIKGGDDGYARLTEKDQGFRPSEDEENSFKLTTWWFGENKRICEICFNAKCLQESLYDLIPQ